MKKQYRRLFGIIPACILLAAGMHGLPVQAEETGDLSEMQWAYREKTGVLFPHWNEYEEGVPVRNTPMVDGQDVVVAVLDTGIDYTHEDLKNVMWEDGLNYPELTAMGGGKYGFDAVGKYDAETRTTRHDDPMDEAGHGTHVAGIIGAEWNGIGVSGALSGVRLMAVRCSHGGSNVDEFRLGMQYVLAAKKAGVNIGAVNMSWNGGLGDTAPEVLSEMTEALGEAGIVTVISAGNETSDLNDSSYVSSFSRTRPYVLVTAATDRTGSRWEMSNSGTHYAQIASPGEMILSTFPYGLEPDEDSPMPSQGYCYMSGTSMAAPIVTAAATLLYAKDPSLSAGERAAVICSAARNDRDLKVSGGMLDVEGMLEEKTAPYAYHAEYDGFTDLLVIHGYGFGMNGTLMIDGNPVRSSFWSDTEIQVSGIPAVPGEHLFSFAREDETRREKWLNVVSTSKEAESLSAESLSGWSFPRLYADGKELWGVGSDAYSLPPYQIFRYIIDENRWEKTARLEDYSRDGTVLNGKYYMHSSYGSGKEIQVYDLMSGSLLKTIEAPLPDGWLRDFRMDTADGRVLFTFREESGIRRVYELKGDEVKELAKAENFSDELRAAGFCMMDGKPVLLADMISEDGEYALLNLFTVDEKNHSLKQTAETIRVPYGDAKPVFRGSDGHVFVFPVSEKETSQLDGTIRRSILVYDCMPDGTLNQKITVTGGGIAALTGSGAAVLDGRCYVYGNADSIPGNFFLYQIPFEKESPSPEPVPEKEDDDEEEEESETGIAEASGHPYTCQDAGFPEGYVFDEQKQTCVLPSPASFPAPSPAPVKPTDPPAFSRGDEKTETSAESEKETASEPEPVIRETPVPSVIPSISPEPSAERREKGRFPWFLFIPVFMCLSGIVIAVLPEKTWIPFIIGADLLLSLAAAGLDQRLIAWILLGFNLLAVLLVWLYRRSRKEENASR